MVFIRYLDALVDLSYSLCEAHRLVAAALEIYYLA